jgi:hypothetical protein
LPVGERRAPPSARSPGRIGAVAHEIAEHQDVVVADRARVGDHGIDGRRFSRSLITR